MSDKKQINVPDIGDFDGVEVIEILVHPGDMLQAEDPIISLESEKATIEVPSPEAGEVVEVLLKLGDTVSEGTAMIILKPSKASKLTDNDKPVKKESIEKKTIIQQEPVKTKPSPKPVKNPIAHQSTISSVGKLAHASPAVRKFARELGVEIGQVAGSGRKGRINKDDVKNHVKAVMQTGHVVKSGFDVPPLPNIDFSEFGAIESKPLTRIQKLSGKYLHRNWVRIPHVTQYDQADITEMEAFRQENKADAKAQGFNLTPLAFMVKAMAKALKKFPKFNSSLDVAGENIILKHYFNIGIAVDTPNGLVVPVIRDCDKKDVYEIAKEMGEISLKARSGKLSPKDMQGGSISISSLGGIGGTAFTPIINAPEVAILGVSRSLLRPEWDGKQFQPRLMLPLCLSYDHRVIDGAEAARFIVYLSSILSDMKKMLL